MSVNNVLIAILVFQMFSFQIYGRSPIYSKCYINGMGFSLQANKFQLFSTKTKSIFLVSYRQQNTTKCFFDTILSLTNM